MTASDDSSILADFNTVSQVASYLNIPERTLYDLIRAGRMGCVRISERVIRLSREHVLEFIAEKTQVRKTEEPARA